jgi:hypothetical protein
MWTASIASEIVVVGYDPEAAYLDNPRGERYGEAFCIILTNDRGERLIGPQTYGPESRLAAAIQHALDRGYDPTTSDAFKRWHPVYGSQAHDELDLMTRGEQELYFFGRTLEWD